MQEKANPYFVKSVHICVVLSCILAACANNAPKAESATVPADASEALLDYTQSGGITGMNDTLLILGDGACTVTRKNSSHKFTLSPSELDELKVLLKDCYPDPPKPVKPGAPVLVMADQVTCTFKTADQDFSCDDVKMPERIRNLVEEINKRYIRRLPQ